MPLFSACPALKSATDLLFRDVGPAPGSPAPLHHVDHWVSSPPGLPTCFVEKCFSGLRSCWQTLPLLSGYLQQLTLPWLWVLCPFWVSASLSCSSPPSVFLLLHSLYLQRYLSLYCQKDLFIDVLRREISSPRRSFTSIAFAFTVIGPGELNKPSDNCVIDFKTHQFFPMMY